MLGLPEEFTPDFLARLEQLRIKTRREFAGLGKGTHLSPRRGSSLEFSDFRHYSLGDDFRYIDWGLYGRTDKLYIKLFKEEEDLLTYIFLDASASMGFPEADRKFESAVATALAIAYVALAPGDRVMMRVLAGERQSADARLRLRTPSDRRAGAAPGRDPARRRARFRDGARARTGLDPPRRQGLRDLGLPDDAELGHARAGPVHRRQHGRDRGADSWRQRDDGRGTRRATSRWSTRKAASACGSRSASASASSIAQTLLRLAREIKTFCLQRGLHYTLYTTDLNFHDFFLRAARRPRPRRH